MDDAFAIISLLCLLLWAFAALAIKLRPTKMVLRLTKAVYEWRGFFIALIVIALFRICFYEMFWIPSASMQPTLREGEFVIVDKRAYGIRMPLTGTRLTAGLPPARGEIVVFRHPQDEGVFYIKRIIGLPGDKLVIEGNAVLIDGTKLNYRFAEEKYVYNEQRSGSFFARLWNMVSFARAPEIDSTLFWEQLPEGWHPMLLSDPNRAPSTALSSQFCTSAQAAARLECIVPEGNFFVLGDNRHRSNDSRFWGFVPEDNLVGPARAVALSLDRYDRSFSSLGLSSKPERQKDIPPPLAGTP